MAQFDQGGGCSCGLHKVCECATSKTQKDESKLGEYDCKECNGTGQVVFTRERGGPICNGCAGHGGLTRDLLVIHLAGRFDYPSVYMGGPSDHSKKRADDLVRGLEREFNINWKTSIKGG